MTTIRVQDTVSVPRPVVTVDAGARVSEAVQTMRRHGIHHLIVCDGKDQAGVVGVVGDRDVYARGLLPSGTAVDPTRVVRDVMTPLASFLDERSDLREALDLMRTHGVSALPLVREGRLIGIVTESDLLQLLDRALSGDRAGDDEPEATAEERGKILMANPVIQNVMHLLAQAGI